MPQTAPLSTARTLAYASGNFGKNILWGTTELALLFVLTELFGVEAWLASALLLVSLAWDAIVDPVIGALADRSNSRLGRYGPFILFGAPCAAISFFVLFAAPAFGATNIALAVAALFAFRTAYSVVDLPHNALLARVATAPEERSRLAGYRFIFSSVATLVIGATLPGILDDRADGAAVVPLAVWAGVVGVVACATLVVAWFAVRTRDSAVVTPARKTIGLTRTFATPAVRIVVIAGGLAAITTPLFPKVLLYHATYVGRDTGLAGLALTVMALGQIAGAPFWIWMSTRLNRAKALVVAHGVIAACGVAIAIAPPAAAAGYGVAAAAYGFGASGVYTIIWSMLADSVDDNQRATGARAEATIFAFAILVMQAAAGVGAVVVGGGLSLAGYSPGAAWSAELQTAIVLIAGLGPAVGAVVCIALLWPYPITHRRHAETIRELNAGAPAYERV